MLSVDIEDNGRGFSQKPYSSGASSGLGLLGMRERAMMLGGTLTIDSSLGRGTKVQLRLPTAEMSALKRIR
jgi:signal transduction histidine kinase